MPESASIAVTQPLQCEYGVSWLPAKLNGFQVAAMPYQIQPIFVAATWVTVWRLMEPHQSTSPIMTRFVRGS